VSEAGPQKPGPATAARPGSGAWKTTSGSRRPVQNSELQLPHIQLDALAYEFDEDHIEGTGDIRWKGIVKDAADRAAQEPGYNSRGIDPP
jgi:hypothetical protein